MRQGTSAGGVAWRGVGAARVRGVPSAYGLSRLGLKPSCPAVLCIGPSDSISDKGHFPKRLTQSSAYYENEFLGKRSLFCDAACGLWPVGR